MNKWIKKAVIGSVIIAMLTVAIVYFFYISERKKFKVELQNVIDNKYLEGKTEIGAYFLNIDSIKLDKVEKFDASDNLSWLFVNKSGVWNSLTFSNLETINAVMTAGKYEWYNFHMEGYYPLMIVVKKTSSGYDIIGEYIVGVGLKHNFPKQQIHQTSTIFKGLKLNSDNPNNKFLGDRSVLNNYSIPPSMTSKYINYLVKDRYKGILLRNEISRTQPNLKENRKLSLLNELVKKYAAPADESLFFRTNKYFELKYDDNYTYMGTSPILWETSNYGNDVQQLFTRTVTLHYSIQENEGILRAEYIKIFAFIFVGGIILYLLIIFFLSKKIEEV